MSRVSEWRDGIALVQAEAQGCLSLEIITPDHQLGMISSVLVGDLQAMILFRAIGEAVRGITACSPHEPALCLCCPAEIRNVVLTFGIAVPAVADPQNAIAFAICQSCADPHGLFDRVMDGLRRIWPELRPVTLHSPGSA